MTALHKTAPVALAAMLIIGCGSATSNGTGSKYSGSGTCETFDIDALELTMEPPKGGKQVVRIEPEGKIPKSMDLTWSVEGEGVEILDKSVSGGRVLTTKLDLKSLDPGDKVILTVSVYGRCDKLYIAFREHLDLCVQDDGFDLLPYEHAECS